MPIVNLSAVFCVPFACRSRGRRSVPFSKAQKEIQLFDIVAARHVMQEGDVGLLISSRPFSKRATRTLIAK